jgi:gliding motility-associated-like protein
LLLLLCNSICFCAYGQKPIIIPKVNPVLPLDGNGQYTILPGDIATFSNYNPDSPLIKKITPATVTCDMRGNQSIDIRALTNGAAIGDISPFNVSFRGNFITGVTYDTQGNLFVIEDDSYSIRKITPEGTVTIFAGTGYTGATDGPGNKAQFGALDGIIADKYDNIYVADYDNNTIRKITPDGLVSTLAGTGFPGHDDGAGNKASFLHPSGIDIDADGNIYLADTGNGMIRKITPAGVVTTMLLAPSQPLSIAVGPDGYIYWTHRRVDVSDKKAFAIYRAKPGGTAEIYAGNEDYVDIEGPRLNAGFAALWSIKFGPGGNLFLGDKVIKKISPDGIVSTFVNNTYYIPFFAIDQCGNLVLGNDDIVVRYSMDGTKSFVAGGVTLALTGNVPPSPCQFADATIPVIVQSKPTLPDIDNKTVSGCATLADYTLHLATTDNCPGATVTYTQSPAAGTPFTNASPVVVTITATDNTGGTDSKTFTVTNTSVGTVTPSVTVTAVNNAVCEGEQVSFHAAVTNGDAGTQYQWQVNGVNEGTNSPDFKSPALQNNDRVNCIVTTGGGCGVPNSSNGVNVIINPKPAINLKPAEQILAGTSINLNPVVTGNITSYKWEPALGLSDANSQYPVASPDVTTTYKLTAITDRGCDNNASVTITVVHQISIPNTFTPNADGYNDLWVIKYLDAYTNCKVSVYNRNGGLLYQSKGYNVAWNGATGGKALPAGVYYYIIDLGDGSTPLSGNVTIIR